MTKRKVVAGVLVAATIALLRQNMRLFHRLAMDRLVVRLLVEYINLIANFDCLQPAGRLPETRDFLLTDARTGITYRFGRSDDAWVLYRTDDIYQQRGLRLPDDYAAGTPGHDTVQRFLDQKDDVEA